MSYVLKYTSLENISNRLRGRLNVQTSSQSNNLISAASGTVDSQYISQIAQQVETKITLALGQIYQTPIPQTATDALQVIGALVEKLIISEIALTHFKIQVNPDTGSDQGYINTIRRQALEEAELIFGGHGIYIPGIMNRPANAQQIGEVKQPLVLPGLQLLTGDEQPDTFSRNVSYVAKRELPEDQQLFKF